MATTAAAAGFGFATAAGAAAGLAFFATSFAFAATSAAAGFAAGFAFFAASLAFATASTTAGLAAGFAFATTSAAASSGFTVGVAVLTVIVSVCGGLLFNRFRRFAAHGHHAQKGEHQNSQCLHIYA